MFNWDLLKFKILLQDLLIFSYLDFLEILIFSFGIYKFAAWLKHDKQKKLTPVFFSFCFLIIISNYLKLNNLNNFLLTSWPVILVLFILVHQNTLQKNFIALKNIIPAKKPENHNWITNLISASLTSKISNLTHKKILYIIEGEDNLDDFLESDFVINAEINRSLLEALLRSPVFNNHKIIWLSQLGKLLAINSYWNTKITSNTLENCLLLSQKTDLIFLEIDQKEHTFNIISQGKLSKNLPTNDAIKLLTQYVRKNSFDKINNNSGVNWNDLENKVEQTETGNSK